MLLRVLLSRHTGVHNDNTRHVGTDVRHVVCHTKVGIEKIFAKLHLSLDIHQTSSATANTDAMIERCLRWAAESTWHCQGCRCQEP